MSSRGRAIVVMVGLHLLGAVVFFSGIAWGLPSRRVDAYLFGDRAPWTGAEILQLVGGVEGGTKRGADVDANPIGDRTSPVVVNDTDAKRAEIVRRYRLYSYQPDEMITLMALAKMKPGAGDFDPKLYQYGGLWVYPVGALLKVAGMCGLIELKSDLAFYLDHPEAFGRFYIVARAYSATWGLLGIGAVYWLTRRFGEYLEFQTASPNLGKKDSNFESDNQDLETADSKSQQANTGLKNETVQATKQGDQLSAGPANINSMNVTRMLLPSMAVGCYLCLPVVVNMAHEAKPHLAGAVLMLWAAVCGLRYVATRKTRWALATGMLCGLAFGMVLSAMWAFSIIPTIVLLRKQSWGERLKTMSLASAAGVAVYFLTNPYVLIHLLNDRAMLQSNLGNSQAMYAVKSLGAAGMNGFVLLNVAMGFLLPVMGLVAWVWLSKRKTLWIVAVPVALVLIQFFALAAGKPGEYARFALFPAIIFVVISFAMLSRLKRLPAIVIAFLILVSVIPMGLWITASSFVNDTRDMTSRLRLAERVKLAIQGGAKRISVYAEPAPYSVPPVDLFKSEIVLMPRDSDLQTSPPVTDTSIFILDRQFAPVSPPWFERTHQVTIVAGPAIHNSIGWADKRFVLVTEYEYVSSR